ncbi:TPR3-like protein [Drosera capensis]
MMVKDDEGESTPTRPQIDYNESLDDVGDSGKAALPIDDGGEDRAGSGLPLPNEGGRPDLGSRIRVRLWLFPAWRGAELGRDRAFDQFQALFPRPRVVRIIDDTCRSRAKPPSREASSVSYRVVDETQIAVFESQNLDTFKRSIFVCCEDGKLTVLITETLTVSCVIEAAPYLPPDDLSTWIYPLSVATNPSFPNQFAVGLSDGAVHVLEQLEKDRTWGVNPPLETVCTYVTMNSFDGVVRLVGIATIHVWYIQESEARLLDSLFGFWDRVEM